MEFDFAEHFCYLSIHNIRIDFASFIFVVFIDQITFYFADLSTQSFDFNCCLSGSFLTDITLSISSFKVTSFSYWKFLHSFFWERGYC